MPATRPSGMFARAAAPAPHGHRPGRRGAPNRPCRALRSGDRGPARHSRLPRHRPTRHRPKRRRPKRRTDARPRRRPPAARVLRRLALAVPRLRHGGRGPQRGRVHPPRGGHGVARRPGRLLRGPRRHAHRLEGDVAARRPRRLPHRRRPHRQPQPAHQAPARRGQRRRAASWASRSTAACCSTAGSTATWACRAAWRSGASRAGAIVRLLRLDRAVCAIPQLAIHLDRECRRRASSSTPSSTCGPCGAWPPATTRACSGASWPRSWAWAPTTSSAGTSCSTTWRPAPCWAATTS